MFYLNELNVCESVTIITGCQLYQKNADTCKECITGKYFNSEYKDCRPNPTGLSNCSEFNPDASCNKCVKNYYLNSEKQCTISDPLVDHCDLYSDNAVCETCEDDFTLNSNNKCLKVYAGSCLTYENPYKCATCQDNFVLNQHSATINCVPSGIENCKNAVKGVPNTCNICNPGFILSIDKTSCDASQNPIEFCYQYLTSDICEICKPNYYLSENRRSCIELNLEAGSNCSQAKQFDLPICNMCDFGYYKDVTGICQKCSSSGCAFCDPNDPNSCQLCNDGFYMNDELACVVVTRSPEPDHVNIISLVFVLMFAVLFSKEE